MSWVRRRWCTGAPQDRSLSDAAFRLWIVGLTYCNQQANDGRFSAASARIAGYLASPEFGRGAMAELCAGWPVGRNSGQFRDPRLPGVSAQPRREGERKQGGSGTDAQNERAAKHGVREPLQRNNAGTSPELPPKFSLPRSRTRPVPIPYYIGLLCLPEPSQPGLPIQPQPAADTTKKPTEAQVRERIALVLFAEIVAARMSVIPGAEKLEPRPAALAGLKHVSDGATSRTRSGEINDLKTGEVRADPKQKPEWFRPTVL